MTGKIILRIVKTILQIIKNYLADSGTWNLPHTRVQNKMFVERRSTWPENSQPISGQDKDKTNPSLMTGLRRKPYTRN